MKYEVNETKTLCTFDELDEDARENAARMEEECIFHEDMKDMFAIDVDYYFSTEVHMQYDFSCSQGSGLNVYGTFDMNELLHYAMQIEDKRLEGVQYEHGANRWYTYCTWDIEEDYLKWAMVDECGLPESEAEGYAEKICEAMEDLCRNLYNRGEEQLEWYRMPEHWEGSEMLFTEDGKFYCYEWELPKHDAA